MSPKISKQREYSRYLRLVRLVILCFGLNELWYNKGWFGKFIRVYCIIACFIYFTQTVLINLYAFFIFDETDDWRELCFFFTSTVTVNVTAYKYFFFRSETMQKLFKEAFDNDRWIRRNPHLKIRNSYKSIKDEVFKITIMYLMSLSVCIIILYVGTLFLYLKGRKCDLNDPNSDCVRKQVWAALNFFSLETEFGWALFTNKLGLTYIGIFVFAANMARSALCIFPTFKLRHLSHVLKNFQQYGRLLSVKEHILLHDAEYYVVKRCIKEHHKILSDFRKLISNTQMLFFLDFLTTAMQMVPYPVICMGSKEIDHVYLFACGCFGMIYTELFMIYWFGQYIIDESENIQKSIYLSHWYEADVRTRKMLLLIMMRSSRRLALKVGPFYQIELNIFLRIIRGLYSAFTIFRRSLSGML